MFFWDCKARNLVFRLFSKNLFTLERTHLIPTHTWSRRVRRKLGTWCIDHFILSLAKTGRLHPRAYYRNHRIRIHKDIAYTTSKLSSQSLDIYFPYNDPQPWPIVLYIHGGGFRSLSKASHWLMPLIFARAGFLVFNINYRLAPQFPFPAAVHDVSQAFCWIVDNSSALGGDSNKIVVSGESAGANLALALSLMCCQARQESYARQVWKMHVLPRVIVPTCGLMQVSNIDRFQTNSWANVFLQDHLAEIRDSYLGTAIQDKDLDLSLADPLCVLESTHSYDRPLPEFLVAVGDNDPIKQDSVRLKLALDNLQTNCAFWSYDGAPHAFHALIWRQDAQAYWRDALHWIHSRL